MDEGTAEPQLGAQSTTAVTGSAEAAPVKVKTRKPSAETTFRVLLQEQMNLTTLADSKANMMIQINGLIMSIMLASSSIILHTRIWLILPCASLAATALLSIIFAVLVVRPQLQRPRHIGAQELDAGRGNLLFFGNFGRLQEEEFVQRMKDLFADDDRVYEHLSRHMHALGYVLLGKFRLLRFAYLVFLVGLCLSGALFVFGLIMTRYS